jgi:hypothetical protein
MDFSISSKRNVSAFQATFLEMLSAWSASFLTGYDPHFEGDEPPACRETPEPSTDDAAAVAAESLFSPFQVYPRQPDHFPIADHPGVK